MRSSLSLLGLLVLGACDASGPPEPLAPLSTKPSFAVRSTNYDSSSFALLDAAGEPLHEGWVTSGTLPVGVSSAIHSDNFLPTVNAPDGSLTIIDAYGADRITRFAMPEGTVIGQMKTQLDEGSSAFSSNPYDVVFLEADRALVSRYGANFNPEAAPGDRGTDLLEFNPATMELTGARVDLSIFNGSAEIEGDEGPVTVDVLARPAHMVSTGNGYVVVGLERLTAGFEAAAPGAVAVVDAESYAVTSFDVDGLTNCGVVLPVPGAPDDVAVRCLGFGGPEGAGLVVLSVGDDGVATERARILPTDTPEIGNLTGGVLMLSAETFVGVVSGTWGDATAPDVIYLVELDSFEATEVLRTRSGYDVFGPMAFREETGLVLIPSSSEGLHRFHYADGVMRYDDTLTLYPSALGVSGVLRLD